MDTSKQANQTTHEFLKIEIANTLGKNIKTSGDCLLLSNDIFNKISFKVNSNTLRRFFGLVKSNHSPSLTTLDILSKYCGFNSFDQFLKLKNKKYIIDTNNHYADSILNYLVSIFRETPVKESEDKTFSCVVKETITFIERHPELIDKFQRGVSKTKNGQDFYFEQFINIDKLNSFYGEGLLYYLLEKKTIEAQIFGHSLLCLKNWLTGNDLELARHYKHVNEYTLTKELHPLLSGRFFASQLLYADMCNLSTEKILTEARQIHKSIKYIKIKGKYRFFPCFEYIICPILFFTRHYEEALYYVNYYLDNYKQKPSNIDTVSYLRMDLYAALVFIKTGQENKAYQLYKRIFPSNFSFLSKRYDTIMYSILNRTFDKAFSQDDHFSNLIQETGFKRLGSFN
jgi:hypothetical protein